MRDVSALFGTPSPHDSERSHECERGTQECVRYHSLASVRTDGAFCARADTKPAIDSFSRKVRECVQCHAAESKAQPLTPMAHAAETNAECSVLKSHPLMKLRLGRYDYRIERQGDRSMYSVTDGVETVTYPIRYAFGLGEAGQTYILEKDGEYYESFVSYYQAIDALDITIGDQPLKPSSLRDAAGRHIGISRNCDVLRVPHEQRRERRACVGKHALAGHDLRSSAMARLRITWRV